MAILAQPRFSFWIGGLGLTIDLSSAGCWLDINDCPPLAAFTSPSTITTPDYELILQVDTCQSQELITEVDPRPQSWHFSRNANQLELLFRPPLQPGGWTHQLTLDLAQNSGILRLANTKAGQVIKYLELFPAFLDKFIFTTMLERVGGFFLHAAAVADGQQGIVFTGESGAGKSTLSRLWQEFGGSGVINLTDESTILRQNSVGEFQVYGTPWPSSANLAHPAGVPLSRLYFLEHASRNFAEPLTFQMALLKLLSQSQLPVWDNAATSNSLDFVIKMLQSYPVFRLGFKPDVEVVACIRGWI
jgi:hypothetical protein